MRYIDEFHNPAVAQAFARSLCHKVTRPVNLMEVCGTHTVAIFRHGIRQLLPEQARLLSGPGCPVCVTPNADIDKAIALAQRSDVILTTYGDMIRVPGSYSSLAQAKAEGAEVRVLYSALDSLAIARANPQKKVVFLAVGFETTIPTIAASVMEAERQNISNFFILSVHKLIPPAMKALLEMGEVHIDGFICPGHVSTIIGSRPYEFIARDFGIPCVIAGFEPLDVLQSIDMLLDMVLAGKASVDIQYRRAVRAEGNPAAQELVSRVFQAVDASWRGLGTIPQSGLRLRPEYRRFDAEEQLAIEVKPPREHPGCGCGEILRGIKTPPQCALFGKACTPERPVGPCMVSSEGTCAGWYQYGGEG